jgi:hypothetical protein
VDLLVSNLLISLIRYFCQRRIFLLCAVVSTPLVTTEQLDSLGDSITTAVLLSWSKEPGDSIKEDDVIAVVETDKVFTELLY